LQVTCFLENAKITLASQACADGKRRTGKRENGEWKSYPADRCSFPLERKWLEKYFLSE
jgi:hypothetical protein